MKKIILTVAAVFALTFANAQDKKEGSEGFAKGDLYLSGTVGFSNCALIFNSIICDYFIFVILIF